jgi:hypothetical protein
LGGCFKGIGFEGEVRRGEEGSEGCNVLSFSLAAGFGWGGEGGVLVELRTWLVVVVDCLSVWLSEIEGGSEEKTSKQLKGLKANMRERMDTTTPERNEYELRYKDNQVEGVCRDPIEKEKGLWDRSVDLADNRVNGDPSYRGSSRPYVVYRYI